MKVRPAAGGGRTVDITPDRLPGWVNRYVGAHGGAREPNWTESGSVRIEVADGGSAEITAPYPPLRTRGDQEPLEALLAHVDAVGVIAVLAFRAGAHSVGLIQGRQVIASSTDRHYVQGRTAAGGWSQQRYARRRGNQRDAAAQAAADDAQRVWQAQRPTALLLAGDRRALADVIADPRLAAYRELPVRTIPDVAEPRRALLDDLAVHSLDLTIVIRDV